MVKTGAPPRLEEFTYVVNRLEPVLLGILEAEVEEKTTIYCDCWAAYHNIHDQRHLAHWTVNHTLYFKDPVTGVHINRIEGTWTHLLPLTEAHCWFTCARL
ncbi:hypothetical protein BLNAU_4146 [Blattamonas nauphoetae]|uniref:ISXO2-like transposase domain-containing protein n=1 Tax=Blattamonas nauphoetae TaxID=2049346 RepID=A0ABQ9YAK6_9EUKA|nr:hypothetical protein BLNAU_4146 [Blattamonas nauphoetae]